MLARSVTTWWIQSLVVIVGEDLGVERRGLLVGDAVEIDAVEVAEGGELIAVEAGCPGVVEVVLGPGPPGRERLARTAGCGPVDLGEVTGSPEAIQGHAPALVGLDQARQAFEGPEVVMRVDGRDGVERGLDSLVGRRGTDVLTRDGPGVPDEEADQRDESVPLHGRGPLLRAYISGNLGRRDGDLDAIGSPTGVPTCGTCRAGPGSPIRGPGHGIDRGLNHGHPRPDQPIHGKEDNPKTVLFVDFRQLRGRRSQHRARGRPSACQLALDIGIRSGSNRC